MEVPSPPELIGDRLGARVPVRPFLDLIGVFGSYGRLKAFSVFSVLLHTLSSALPTPGCWSATGTGAWPSGLAPA